MVLELKNEEEASETTIAELFARDPMQLSDQEITLIVQKFRSMRFRYNAGAVGAGKTAVKKTPKQRELDDLSDKLSLDDLIKL